MGPTAITDLVAQAWSWLEGVLGVSAPRQSTDVPKKDTTVMPPVVYPPTGTSGSGSMVDPDGKPK